MWAERGYRIVVGVDGSPSSLAALRWALWQAGLAGGWVTAVLAWEYPAFYGWAPAEPEGGFAALMSQALADAVDQVVDEAMSVPVRQEVVEAHPATALLAAAEHADLLVVGNRGHAGLTEALLGSVSQRCVHHARCPVVVVRQFQQTNSGSGIRS